MPRKTNAQLTAELEDAQANLQRLAGDLDFAKKALDTEKRKVHEAQLNNGVLQKERDDALKLNTRLAIEHRLFKKGALDALVGE